MAARVGSASIHRWGPTFSVLVGIVTGLGLVGATILTTPICAGLSGIISGSHFTPGNCIYCPSISAAPSYDLPRGTVVNVSWSEVHGWAIDLVIGPPSSNPDGAIPCPSWESASTGFCGFWSAGGMYTLDFESPSPPSEAGYTANYTITYHCGGLLPEYRL